MADKLTILICDDSMLLRKKLKEDLEALGCEVVQAENGKDGIMKELQFKPDGVFLDVVMPEVGGVEALRVFKQINPDLPVVMLSSMGTPEVLMETLKMGVLGFIQKPYELSQLEKAVNSIRKKVGKDEN